MSDEKKYALDVAKEITIAHLNNANPTSPCKETGVCVGEIFKEIYNKIFSLISNQQ